MDRHRRRHQRPVAVRSPSSSDEEAEKRSSVPKEGTGRSSSHKLRWIGGVLLFCLVACSVAGCLSFSSDSALLSTLLGDGSEAENSDSATGQESSDGTEESSSGQDTRDGQGVQDQQEGQNNQDDQELSDSSAGNSSTETKGDQQEETGSSRDLPTSAAEALDAYQDAGTCVLVWSGYLDMRGRIWSCMVQGDGWVEICVVREDDEELVHTSVVRMDAKQWASELGVLEETSS